MTITFTADIEISEEAQAIVFPQERQPITVDIGTGPYEGLIESAVTRRTGDDDLVMDVTISELKKGSKE